MDNLIEVATATPRGTRRQGRPSPPSRRVIAMAWQEDEGCFICGLKRVERAHIVPYSLGGSNEPTNYALLCSMHHEDAPDVGTRAFFDASTTLLSCWWADHGSPRRGVTTPAAPGVDLPAESSSSLCQGVEGAKGEIRRVVAKSPYARVARFLTVIQNNPRQITKN